IHLTISLQKLQQKALQQPKQKKSKSAEFLMGESSAAVGIENPAFDGGRSAKLCVPLVWLGIEIRGDRPDTPAKERGDERAQNYFDPSLAQQIDPRHCRMAGVSTEDELELTILKADENRLYRRTAILLEEGDTFIDIPGTLQASRDEKVLEVKTGDPVLQQRPLLHGGGHASGSRPSQTHTVAKPLDEASAGLGGEAGLEAGRMIMGRESTVKMRIAEEAIPHNAQQLREPVQSDMITLGSLSLQQVRATKRSICVIIPYSPAHQPCPLCCSMTPQHVELCLCCLRATREKLPRGLYTVSVTLYSHLGGSALVRCGKKEQQRWTVSTEPVEHRGNFYDTDLLINQNLFMILPAAREVVPCMVLIFQLIALGGDRSHISSIVAWGAFPVCGPNLSLVQGRFKTPLLRGEPNAELDQFKKIESLISSDLDHWLCNVYFQVKMLPSGAARGPEPGITLPMPPPNSPVISKPGVQLDHPHSQLQLQSQPLTTSQLCPQSQIYDQQHNHAGPSSRVGDAAVVYSERGSPLHLSADSACSSSSLPGAISGNTGEKCDPCRLKAEGGIHHKKKPIKKTNSCGPSMSSSSAPPRQADKQKMQPSMENLSTEELEEYTFSLQSALKGPRPSPSRLSDRARLALRMLPSDLGLPLLGQQQQRHASWRGCVWRLSLIMLLMALMWFVRLYLHYCSQWLYLQAIAVPVNKFEFHTHTVELIYQSSLLHIWEEMAMLVVGPLTLNTLTFLLVLIRWGCQQIFGSLPSFTSKFIMAQGVWTVLDPLAVFAVDAVLGRLSYSPDTPVGDAAKLYWHFHRTGQSGAAGVVITLFLYAVLFLLSVTILSVYLLRFHNDGHMLDIFQRLTAKEGTYFLPEDLELSNQELSYIVKKAEQWRGFNGERRNVVVYDHIRTAEDPLPGSSLPSGDGPSKQGAPQPEAETSTHVVIYTLYPSGLKQRYRHFLRQSDGAIIEVRSQHINKSSASLFF
uniref:Uncharacterized protein n=1 Tax=Echeneis naucrates TaxID=173247 RepID=A0A665V3Z9_ECHNA